MFLGRAGRGVRGEGLDVYSSAIQVSKRVEGKYDD